MKSSFRILCLDGGGVRGAFTAAYLATIEEQLKQPCVDYFDLIVGTSTGGIVAAALALGIPATRVQSLYETSAEAIFAREPVPARVRFLDVLASQLLRWGGVRGLDIDLEWFRKSKYSSTALRKAVIDIVGNRPIREARRCRLLLTSVDLKLGRPVVFKTPHLPGLTRDPDRLLVDAIMSTTAAPMYFVPHEIETKTAFCDGGLWANNPSLVGLAEAHQISRTCKRAVDPVFTPDDVLILSIGTCEKILYFTPPENPGVLWWAPRMADLALSAQSSGVDSAVSYILGDRFRRVSRSLPDGSWELDAAIRVPDLIAFGRQTAHETLSDIRTAFLSEKTTQYVPFS